MAKAGTRVYFMVLCFCRASSLWNPKEAGWCHWWVCDFPLNLSVNLVDSIIWVFNSTTLVTIQPKTAGKKALVIVTQKRNMERVNFPHEGYSLKLSRLKKNDSGIYRVEIHSSTLQDPLTQEYELHVYGEQNQVQRRMTAFIKW